MSGSVRLRLHLRLHKGAACNRETYKVRIAIEINDASWLAVVRWRFGLPHKIAGGGGGGGGVGRQEWLRLVDVFDALLGDHSRVGAKNTLVGRQR